MNSNIELNDCIHKLFTVFSRENIICAECGDEVLLHVPDDELCEVYFEILHKEADGSFTSLQRGYRAQMSLMLDEDCLMH